MGSYGIGKMVYAVTSGIHMMAYYSVFEPTSDSDTVDARFMATAFLPRHEIQGVSYTGHAFFGEDSGDIQYPSRPIESLLSHDIARSIGLERRSADDTGLSVIIVDCDITIKVSINGTPSWFDVTCHKTSITAVSCAF